VLLPLFSAVSSRSWGIGDFADLPPLANWLGGAGFSDLMLLPLGTISPGESSPYSAASAMALDPIFIAVPEVEDFRRAGGEAAMATEAKADLLAAVQSTTIQHAAVRRAKDHALDLAFRAFLNDEWSARTMRASQLAAYIVRERWWLDDYALFQAIARSSERSTSWTAWPAELATREPHALAEVRRHLAGEVLRQQYLQWIAEGQWQTARRMAGGAGIRIFGDVPFMVESNSADVWTRAGEFHLDLAAGVPPDSFSATGQDWGLPVYKWEAVAASGFEWLRARARRAAALFDGIRLDHLVGFYRTYARPRAHSAVGAGLEPPANPEGFFTPADEPTQLWQGEQVLAAVRESGLTVLAEDLGVIPEFVRASLERLHVPGYKVLRWERDWSAPGQPLIDPARYPRESVAATGTHDTETMAAWWESTAGTFDDEVRDKLLTSVLQANSEFAFLPMQDLFGWRDRINTPATVGPHNWTWKLPWPIDQWPDVPDARERAAFCRRAIES
jgi:4-alpha-glucanotransferase